jgi:putative MATE family efflux protein
MIDETPSPQKKLKLFALTWPIFIELSLHMLMGNIDTFMLSQYSDEAVASVGVANQLQNMFNILFGFVAVGTTILISQYIGAKKIAQAHQIATTSLMMNLVFGIILSIILVTYSETALGWLGLKDNLMAHSKAYISVIGSFMFVQALLLTVSAIMKSHGHTRDVMFITITMNILNIIGNYIFIFGPFGLPVLGVVGVAISTVSSRIIGLCLMSYILMKRVNIRSNPKEPKTPRRKHMGDLLRIGIPSAGELLAHNTSQLMITSFITSIGTIALITRVYTMNVMFFIMLFSIAISQGTQIIIARMVGGNEYDQAYKQGLRSLGYGMLAALLMAVLFNLVGKYILGIFTDDPEIIKLGSTLLLLSFLLEPGRSLNLIIIASLRAAGDVRFPVYVGVVSMWGVAVPAAYILGIHFGYGLIGIFIAFIIDEWLRGLLMLYRWRRRRWQQKHFASSHEDITVKAPG